VSLVQTHITRAQKVLEDASTCGIAIVPSVTVIPAPTNKHNWSCDSLTALLAANFEPGTLNVFYVGIDRTGNGHRGSWCGPRPDPRGGKAGGVILVSAVTSNKESLAHEIGHALSLDHTEDDPLTGLERTERFRNVMFSETDESVSVVREGFNAGQCIRMHAHGASWLRTVRAGSVTRCLNLPFLCPISIVPGAQCP
jgi:hypothetical protein